MFVLFFSSSYSFESLVALSWLCAVMRVRYKTAEQMMGTDFTKLVFGLCSVMQIH